MRLDAVVAAIAEPERFVPRQVSGLSGAEVAEPTPRWQARAVLVALNRYQSIPLDVFAVVEHVLRHAKAGSSSSDVARAVVDAIHAGADPVGIMLAERGLPPDAGLARLLAAVRGEVLRDVYDDLSARGRGNTRGSWQQAASAVHRRRIGSD